MAFESSVAAAAGFTLVCPGYRAASAHAGASAAEGHLAIAIGAQLVAELSDGDLAESWAAVEDMTTAEQAALSGAAAESLMDLLEQGLSAADLAEAVTDAAVLFLLAMKRHGVSDHRRIPACSVRWNSSERGESVLFSA